MSRLALPESFTAAQAPPKEGPQTTRPQRPHPPGKPLWAHQWETIDFGVESPAMLDFSDPGTAKTRGHLYIFHELLEAGACSSLLVLCPKTLMQAAWGADLQEYFPGTPYSLAYAENREQAFEGDIPIFITNVDAVKWMASQPKRFFKRFGPNPMLVVDESTVYKHRTSQRSKAARVVSTHFKAGWRRMLTGTPNPNSVQELWHQTLLVDDGQRLGARFAPFRNSVCHPVQIGPQANHVKWEDKPRAEEAVSFLLRDITIRHKFEECMDIPPNHTVTRHFQLNKRTRKLYEDFETHALLALENGEVVGVNGAVVRNKLLQIASGAVYHGDGSYTVLDTQRTELIGDLVENRNHSIVFFNWTHQKEQLLKLLTARGISHAIIDGTVSDTQREAIRLAYQAGAYQTLLLHPKTGAHGLTLTRGESIIRASPIYEADIMEQEFRRIARGGQTKVTYTENVVATGTVEELVYANVGVKAERMNNFRTMVEMARAARRAG